MRVSTPLENAREAIKMLDELLRTPYLRGLRFEVEAHVDEVPTVTYTVERLVFKESEEEEDDNS